MLEEPRTIFLVFSEGKGMCSVFFGWGGWADLISAKYLILCIFALYH
jgi:hypothetical protein